MAAVLPTYKNLVVVTTTQVPRARCCFNKRLQEDLKPGGLVISLWAIRPIPVSSRISSSPHCQVRQARHDLQCRLDDAVLLNLHKHLKSTVSTTTRSHQSINASELFLVKYILLPDPPYECARRLRTRQGHQLTPHEWSHTQQVNLLNFADKLTLYVSKQPNKILNLTYRHPTCRNAISGSTLD